MKISKKTGWVAATIVAIFFSYSSNSNSNYSGDFTVTETTSETLSSQGNRETTVTRNYSFNFLGDSSKDVVLEKDGLIKKK